MTSTQNSAPATFDAALFKRTTREQWNEAAAATRPYAGSDRSAPPRGIRFRPVYFKPFFGKFEKEMCQGVHLHLDPRTPGTLVEINFKLLTALGAKDLFAQADPKRFSMFDKANGSDEPRQWLMAGRDIAPLLARWKQECEQFRRDRRKYLLYEETAG